MKISTTYKVIFSSAGSSSIKIYAALLVNLAYYKYENKDVYYKHKYFLV